MYKANNIESGNAALLQSFAVGCTQLMQGIDLTHANAYVVAFGGADMLLGRFEPANVAVVAGGSIEALRVLYGEIGRVIRETEEQGRIEDHLRKYGEPPRFDDYYREVEEDGKTQQADEPRSILEDLADRMGLRFVHFPQDGGPNMRCKDFPDCACGG